MPEATSGVFYLPELLGELAESYERLDRTDDALATMRAALDAGYTGASDPRCRLAEILLRPRRATEARPIFDEVKAPCPTTSGLQSVAERGHRLVFYDSHLQCRTTADPQSRRNAGLVVLIPSERRAVCRGAV
jgi:hypothetical protein